MGKQMSPDVCFQTSNEVPYYSHIWRFWTIYIYKRHFLSDRLDKQKGLQIIIIINFIYPQLAQKPLLITSYLSRVSSSNRQMLLAYQ